MVVEVSCICQQNISTKRLIGMAKMITFLLLSKPTTITYEWFSTLLNIVIMKEEKNETKKIIQQVHIYTMR